MTRKLLLDASIYIQEMRGRRPDILGLRGHSAGVLYFSAVVIAELLRGAFDARVFQRVEKLWEDARKARRLVVPNSSDWHDAAIVVRTIAKKYGHEAIGQARLMADALIAMSARRLGITVVTHNLTDFERIAKFRPFSFVSAADLAV